MRTRGRPHKRKEDKVLPNGLYPKQWRWLVKEAKARGYAETLPLLRVVVDEFIARTEADRAASDEPPMVDKSDTAFQEMITQYTATDNKE